MACIWKSCGFSHCELKEGEADYHTVHRPSILHQHEIALEAWGQQRIVTVLLERYGRALNQDATEKFYAKDAKALPHYHQAGSLITELKRLGNEGYLCTKPACASPPRQ